MELPGSGFLYTLATLAMTFVGFCAIVLVFRQSMGAQASPFHRYASYVYIELGLTSAGFAMLPPLRSARRFGLAGFKRRHPDRTGGTYVDYIEAV